MLFFPVWRNIFGREVQVRTCCDHRIFLENQLHAELYCAGAPGAEQRVLPRAVRRLAPTAQTPITGKTAARIRENRFIQNVEEFGTELSGKPFFYRSVLEQGKIPIAEAIVAENIPTGCSKRAGGGSD